MPEVVERDDGQTLLRLCAATDIPENGLLRVDIDGLDPFCISSASGELYATADTCTHAKASLGEEGELDGFVLTCTWHENQFDIRTGEAISGPCPIPLKTFPVTIMNGDVFVRVG